MIGNQPLFLFLAADLRRITSSDASALHALARAASLVASRCLPRLACNSLPKNFGGNINTEVLEELAVCFRSRTDFRKCKSLRTC
jgi:hypothetical protein